MGKVNLDFFIHDENGDVKNKITFDSLSDIDECIEKLQTARRIFKREIEQEKQKSIRKRKTRKERKFHERESSKIPDEVIENMKKAEEAYNKMPDYLKPIFKPILDMTKELVEKAKNS